MASLRIGSPSEKWQSESNEHFRRLELAERRSGSGVENPEFAATARRLFPPPVARTSPFSRFWLETGRFGEVWLVRNNVLQRRGRDGIVDGAAGCHWGRVSVKSPQAVGFQVVQQAFATCRGSQSQAGKNERN